MPRTARRLSTTGYYHIMVRGVNRQAIFLDNADYDFFVFLLSKYKRDMGVEVIAYCLMNNHVHILLNTHEADKFIKKISSAYVLFFNKKYTRVGHLFQERFKSEPVEDEAYLLTVTRYILWNPQKARIAAFDKYEWNSWRELFYPCFCDIDIVEKIVGNKEALIEYLSKETNDRCIDINECKLMDEAETVEYIQRKYSLDSVEQLKDYSKEKIARALKDLKEDGFTVNQISIATGIGRGIIQRA